jgi:glycosyltransferase involved in cell wall biosynthesis
VVLEARTLAETIASGGLEPPRRVRPGRSATLAAVPDEIVPQRCVLVLPSTGEFDSRTYRIARTLHERGHEVTVLARWKAGLARREVHEVGYPIVRVETTALDGLPFRMLTLPLLRALRLSARPNRRGKAADPATPAAETAPAADPAASARDDESAPGWAHPTGRAPGTGLPSRIRDYIRRGRIFLMIRSHRRQALAVAPAADVYHGMAYMGISVALALGRRHRAKVVYDSRDIYMVAANLARLHGPIKAILTRMERGWARAADRVITVNQPYATELAHRFGVPMPVIVMNCSYRFSSPAPQPRRFHERLGLDPETKVVLYQGGFSVGRGVEQLMGAIRQVSGAVLVVMGYGALEATFREAAAQPANAGRVHVLPAVAPTELLDWVASADVVGALFQHDTLNNYLSTPNKFLEAMAAGVPSVCSDHPGMGPIARETGCGIPVDPSDVDAIAEAIRTIVDASPDERSAGRARALAAAHDTYNWESQVQALLAEYGRLTGRPW